jgi:hypothetical protein
MKKSIFFTISIICLILSSDLASALSVTLTPSSHNGYSVSCFGGRDGAINITVTGGTSPYTYSWSTGATTQNISGLPAGYYQVTITDAVLATCSGNVTLTEPTILRLNVTPSFYTAQKTNISCFSCCNGYINISVTGGVTSYAYSWTNGQTVANISNLCKNIYGLTVTDANGCTTIGQQVMSEPDKDMWTMTGNSGSNPSTQFIGTTDNVDLSFRTNNSEALRVKANGDIKFPSLAGNGNRNLYVDNNGVLKGIITSNCGGIGVIPAWSNDASNLFTNCDWVKVGIGTSTPSQQLEVRHSDQFGGIAINQNSSTYYTSEIKYNYQGAEKWALGCNLGNQSSQSFFIWDHVAFKNRFFIDGYGKIYIGDYANNPPCAACSSSVYKLYVEGGIMTRDVKVTANPFADYVFNTDYKLMRINELEQYIKQNHHLPEIPSAKEIEKNEGFEVGDLQIKLLRKIEEQSLYIIEQQKQIDELKAQMKNIERRK